MMEYQRVLDNSDTDIRKRISTNSEIQKSSRKDIEKYERALIRFRKLTETLNKNFEKLEKPYLTNDEFMKVMKFDQSLAKLWRDLGYIRFFKINGRIYYLRSNVKKLLTSQLNVLKKGIKR
jgi:hypothetical protein